MSLGREGGIKGRGRLQQAEGQQPGEEVEFPNTAPNEHKQCVCGPEDSEQTVACNIKPVAGRVPPLQCESMNITSEESCIDHQMKNDVYCTLGDPPTECIIKYHNIGGTMTCSTKWWRSFSVVCGDACAWTEGEFFDSGTWLAPGRAVVASVALAVLAAAAII